MMDKKEGLRKYFECYDRHHLKEYYEKGWLYTIDEKGYLNKLKR